MVSIDFVSDSQQMKKYDYVEKGKQYLVGFDNIVLSSKETYPRSKSVILSVKHCPFDIPNKSIMGVVIFLIFVHSSEISVQHA